MSNKKNVSKASSIYSFLPEKLSTVYIGYLLITFVLGYHYKYFDIAQAKRAIFLYGTGVYIIFMVLFSLLSFRHNRLIFKKLSAEKYILLTLMLVWGIGMIWNINASESFWGITDKCTGLFLYLLAGCAILFLSKYFKWNGTLSWIFLLVCLIVYILQILNRFSIDPLLMYENLNPNQIPAFLSTLGHMNYNASFNCMMLSANLVFFITARERLSQILYGLCLFLGYAGSICCNSDSVFLGIGVSFLLCIWYAFTHSEKWMPIWKAACKFVLASICIAVLYRTFPASVSFVGEPTIFLSTYVLCAEIILLIAGYIIIKLGVNQLEKHGKLLQKVYTFILAFSFVVLLLLLIYLAQDDTFATGRGLIWRKCIFLFQTSDPIHKLLGYGFNNIRTALEVYQGNAFDISGVDVIMDAHNIMINTLITSGLISILLWTVFFYILLKKAFQKVSETESALFVIVGICAFLAQGLFNGPQIITTPLFLIELGVFWSIL